MFCWSLIRFLLPEASVCCALQALRATFPQKEFALMC
jgi:hypothetical protein